MHEQAPNPARAPKLLSYSKREPLQALQSNRKKIMNFFGTTNMVSKSNNTTTLVRFLSHQLSQYPAATAKALLVSVAKLTGDVKKCTLDPNQNQRRGRLLPFQSQIHCHDHLAIRNPGSPRITGANAGREARKMGNQRSPKKYIIAMMYYISYHC